MIFKSKYWMAGVVLLCASLPFLLCANVAQAGITLGGTRLVYPEKSKEVSIQIKNDSAQDIMVQSWLESEKGAEAEQVPFALTPSISRLGGNKQQVLRLFYSGKGLAPDRESVFWLSVQEIPQRAEENTLQIAMRQRIKVFYRPMNLVGNPEDAVEALKLTTVVEQGKRYVQVRNDSPYFISFGEVKLNIGANQYTVESDMLPPYSVRNFVATGAPTSPIQGGISVDFSNINDYGALVKHKSPL